jgi:TonB family protein
MTMFLHTPPRNSNKRFQPFQLLALIAGAFALLAFAWRSPLIQHEFQEFTGADFVSKSKVKTSAAPIQALENDTRAIPCLATQAETRIFSQASCCNHAAANIRFALKLPFGCTMLPTGCSNPSTAAPGKILDNPAQHAAFPGGKEAIQQFVSVNLQYPEEASRKGIEGKVYTQFVVEKDGSVSQARVLKGVDQELDEEAVRIVRAMPKWNAGEHRNQAVRSYVRMPIAFALAE